MLHVIPLGPPGPPEAPDDLFAGTKYSTVRRLAAGGMGEVFLVLHVGLRREFVIKVLHERFAGNAQLLDRVRIEAQTMGRLVHRHIVAVVDFGVTKDARPFIVMERLVGRTVAAELSERGALPLVEAVGYVLQLLSALEAAHAVGVVHRDIKPENLFLTEDAEGRPVLKLLDFGIARVLPGFADAAPVPLLVPTDTGLVVGTPRFVSPEGARGERVDERADVYAAGLMLYLLLAGRGPFDHLHGEAQVLRAHVALAPTPPSVAAGFPPNQAWPEVLDEIVLCALRKKPAERFQSAREFGETLQRFADEMNAPSQTEAEPRVDAPGYADSIGPTEADSEAEARWFVHPSSVAEEESVRLTETPRVPVEAEPRSAPAPFILTPLANASGRQWLFFFLVIAVTATAVALLAFRLLRYWL